MVGLKAPQRPRVVCEYMQLESDHGGIERDSGAYYEVTNSNC